jgi:hypothetical protein
MADVEITNSIFVRSGQANNRVLKRFISSDATTAYSQNIQEIGTSLEGLEIIGSPVNPRLCIFTNLSNDGYIDVGDAASMWIRLDPGATACVQLLSLLPYATAEVEDSLLEYIFLD